MTKTTCMVPGCESAVRARGNCSIHYASLRNLIVRTEGDDEPVTWELLIAAELAVPKYSNRSVSEFTVGVLATLAERRKDKE